MTVLKKIDPVAVAEGLARGELTLIDIRERDEYAREHIKDTLHMPLSTLEENHMNLETGGKVVFYCRSGNRTEVNCDRLHAHIGDDALLMSGGLNGWKAAGLPVEKNASLPIEINRQVQITAGILTLLGVLLGAFIHPAFYALSAFIGAGLAFSGLSGTCAMASALMIMPWNKAHKA